MTEPLLTMRSVRKRYGATIALDGVDLTLERGEVLALVGENGAGKSTLMKVLSGAHSADDGEMRLDGALYRPRGPLEARASGVIMIYQEISLAQHLSVVDNILLGIEPIRGIVIDRREMGRRAAEALAQVGHPNIPLDSPVARLSIAEQQLVEIARALVTGSKVVVLDEPTSSLTRGDIERLFTIVRRLRDQGQAIVYISHFLEEVREIADRFTVLRDGRTVGSGRVADATEAQIVEMMVGRKVEEMYPRSERRAGEIALEIEGLSSGTRLSEATLTLRRGEVVGIAGLVGAGRTELLRAVFGLDRVRSGDVTVAFTPPAANMGDVRTSPAPPKIRRGLVSPPPSRQNGISGPPILGRRGSGRPQNWGLGGSGPAERWEQGVGMVSEDRKAEGLALSLSISDNVTLTRLPAFFRPSHIDEQARRWADRMGVRRRSVTQSVGDLSGGNQQKVALARLLCHDADVLLLDEPTRGIDVGSKAEIYRAIDELASRGKAILMASSYLPELLGVCDRIAVMRRGRLGPARPVSELDEHRIMLEATGAERG